MRRKPKTIRSVYAELMAYSHLITFVYGTIVNVVLVEVFYVIRSVIKLFC